MRTPNVRNAKQRGIQCNSNLVQRYPTRYAVKYCRGLRVYFDGEKLCCLYFLLEHPIIILVLLEIMYGLPGTVFD